MVLENRIILMIWLYIVYVP